MSENRITFLIQCEDSKGIIAKVTTFFYDEGFNILTCQQFTDNIEDAYFMRVSLDAKDLVMSREELSEKFRQVAEPLKLDWRVYYSVDKANVAILASKTSHCLFDLLEKHSEGKLHCNIPLIISNHETVKYVADQFNIPFHHLPVTAENWVVQQEEMKKLLKAHNTELVVMARFMRILSSDFINSFKEKIINIHHAFLPAFQGANPYKRAYERGVKMIGATAHYATDDLDEGPIIEQDVERVSHASSPAGLTQIGSEIERKVLSKAVKFHLDHRIIVTGNRTIVFPETEG
ncbi:formyltetrahydrofolate deformylase [Gilvimarinus agarilyticus]|uniref:formyltetrahydrofolate deformylase n=1 Tax=Reichenbachiella sp. MSK19-1 TaxID=1897631 RepID=UPI000E6BA7B5|nr:formyltetrahydrofolate deformylase [Reichenbachiella sp. MSK19-1]MBU2886060.1 formyltetrahydrofolate deformylase [Gilvimarinus agarilyticus]RJE74498.1 formyltetrahydrofolate deformylase [Reichenbachiella sp. MSK19-1]